MNIECILIVMWMYCDCNLLYCEFYVRVYVCACMCVCCKVAKLVLFTNSSLGYTYGKDYMYDAIEEQRKSYYTNKLIFNHHSHTMPLFLGKGQRRFS